MSNDTVLRPSLVLLVTDRDEALQILDELSEDYGYCCESYGELYAEYRGEVARFGDAWPGSAIEVANAQASIAAIEADITYLQDVFGLGPVRGPEVPYDHDVVAFVVADSQRALTAGYGYSSHNCSHAANVGNGPVCSTCLANARIALGIADEPF